MIYFTFGLSWPIEVAPAKVHIVATGKEDKPFDVAEKIGTELESLGITVLLDDRRDPSAGVKFKDAELIGAPIIIVVGKALEQGNVEIRIRKSGEKSESTVESAVSTVASMLSKLA